MPLLWASGRDRRRLLRHLRRVPRAVTKSSASTSLEFNHALAALPDGYVEGHFLGRKWGSTIKRSEDGRRVWLYAEELGGTDIISFNLYVVSPERPVVKPCEMSLEKVTEFVIAFVPASAVAQTLLANIQSRNNVITAEL
jgi:hypothetical protein